MVIQEMNRYADSEFRYADKSDEVAIEGMVRDMQRMEEATAAVSGGARVMCRGGGDAGPRRGAGPVPGRRASAAPPSAGVRAADAAGRPVLTARRRHGVAGATTGFAQRIFLGMPKP
jgi:hypothetical protein